MVEAHTQGQPGGGQEAEQFRSLLRFYPRWATLEASADGQVKNSYLVTTMYAGRVYKEKRGKQGQGPDPGKLERLKTNSHRIQETTDQFRWGISF